MSKALNNTVKLNDAVSVKDFGVVNYLELKMNNEQDIAIVEKTSAKNSCVLPHKDVQRFLLDVIEQSNFPGRLVEFVSGVKDVIKNAAISGED